jgi:hypothetical protein
MTAAAAREPNFFLVGASRAGTTSLWRYLKAHPQVFMPSGAGAQKEPSHFCEVAPAWALAYRDRARYLGLFGEANGARAIGEASTTYLSAPEVPARIRAAYPDAKVLIVLRNPADRAYSLYRFLCAIGAERARTFEQALALEPLRSADQRFRRENRLWYGVYQYFESGLYSTQVQRYLETFPREQVRILLYDDLRSDSAATIKQIYKFLGVDDGFQPTTPRYNSSDLMPLSVAFQYAVSWGMNRSAPDGGMGPIRRRLLTANLALGKYRTRRCAPATRRRLLEAYREDLARTAALIERPLDRWLERNGDDD